MSKMKNLISAFPENISEAMLIAKNAKIRPVDREIKNVLICGMGGSGIGGRLVTKWMEEELNVPVCFAQDYSVPNFVSKGTLVIGSSYSGNTEETLSSVERAVTKGAHLIGICSGGRLKEYCDAQDFDSILVPGGNPPRTALAFSMVQLIHVFETLGLISGKTMMELEEAKHLIISEAPTIREEAMELAKFLHGNVGVFYGTSDVEPVLIRARQQFNENSKALCWHHTIPEMNHNELVGWGGGDDRFAAVFFETKMNPRNKQRMEITQEIVSKTSAAVRTIIGKGHSLVQESIYLINLVDWASLYLSNLNRTDPIDIAVIDHLKGVLANS